MRFRAILSGVAWGWLVLLASSVRAAGAEEKPFLSWEDGLYSESPWLRPGKVDFLYKHQPGQNSYNVFGWTPVFKGGGGTIDPDGKISTRYVGGFVRPLAAWPDRGDLIIGAQGVDAGRREDYEVQAEYRFPVGLGVGGGFVEASGTGNDIQFGKLTWRQKWAQWNYILELQGQQVNQEKVPGGYAAVYNEQFMGVAGTDGEQWRATAAYMAPDRKQLFRPVIEVFYVDNSIGRITGPRSIFANATLKYEGGFLSHPARLGRAMGPQGLEYGNPLGFLVPTWNRRLEVWEMGNLMDLRAERIRLPNHTVQERYEGLIFPFQFAQTKNLLDHLFIGGAYARTPAKETGSILGGFSGAAGFLKVSLGVEYEFRPASTTVVVGLIDTF